MFESLVIQSSQGPYSVHFVEKFSLEGTQLLDGEPHFLVDANVARLYAAELAPVLRHPRTIIIEATEVNKSLERTIPIFNRLVENRIRRGHTLVAIGGGIIQDITCFVASTLMRGISWRFIPTTLLAQADSCIGSKSSINLGETKNILGTFHPPRDVHVCLSFLETLEMKDIRSGIGEIIKVHAIDGITAFDRLAGDYDVLLHDPVARLGYIRAALLIKKRFIEEDEFDRGIRNIFNYGHSFGHAIESATNFGVPHGVAVSIGMDMANYIAAYREILPKEHYHRMRPTLRKNYLDYAQTVIPADEMLAALARDKKNTNTMLALILAVGPSATVQRVEVPLDDSFRFYCNQYLAEMPA